MSRLSPTTTRWNAEFGRVTNAKTSASGSGARSERKQRRTLEGGPSFILAAGGGLDTDCRTLGLGLIRARGIPREMPVRKPPSLPMGVGRGARSRDALRILDDRSVSLE
jgi:hypothetical protein